MGYYTRIHLKDISSNITEVIGKVSDYGDVDGRYIKWYSRRADMLQVSRQFPDTLLTVIGHGEGDFDFDDQWIEYYKNGKVKLYPFTYPEFREEDLE